MLRKFAVGLAALGALNAAQVKALGLGEVTVHSALNQPLEAEIDLLQIRDLAASQIITGLADSDEFYLAGVKPTAVLSDIRFELDIRESGGKIFLTTREPIREPFLNFLVEVNWPSGRLVREYTVLLDPPVFTAKDLSPRSAPMPPVSRGPDLAPVTPSVSAPAEASARSPVADSYRVGSDDTLWSIALATRPDRSVSPQRMMLAIQQVNPDAFINNNINRLKSGSVLRIPGAGEIASLDGQDPISEVKRQNVAWRGDAGRAPSPQNGQLDATAEQDGGSGATPDKEASRLRIVSKPAQSEAETQAEDESAPGTLVSDEAQAEETVVDPLAEELLNKNLELEEQLVVTLEGLDKVERDNVELFQRLDQLGNQMASLQRLLELKDQQLAELQVSLSQPEGQAAPPPPVAQESPGMMAALMKYPASLAGAVIALLALIGGLLLARKRKQKEAAAVDAAMAELDAREGKDGAGALKTAAGAAAVAVALDTAQAQTREQQGALDELEVEEDPNDPFNLASDDAGDEFDSLTSEDLEASLGDDLDMDLKIDEPIDEDPEMAEFAESLLNDDDYDLGIEESEPRDMAEAAPQSFSEEEDTDDLDFVLADRAPATPESFEAEPEEDDLDFILGANAKEESDKEPEQSSAPSEPPETDDESELLDELDDLLAMESAENPAERETDASFSEAESELAMTEDEPEVLGELDDLLNEGSTAAPVLGETATASPVEDEEVESLDSFFDQPEIEPVDTAASDDEAASDFAVERIEEPVNQPQVEEDRDDIDRLLAESGADLGAGEAMKPQEAPAVEDESDGDLDALFASFGDDEAESGLSAKYESAAIESSGALDGFEEFDLELEDENEVSGPAEQTIGIDDKGNAATETTEENELDLAGDDDLEAELSQMLEEEGNGLSLEETALDERESEIDYLEGADEVGTKLDLARAYIDMDDSDGARDILDEVLSEGTASQVEEARQLLASFKQ